ncbi:hypothetical protein PUNSTDRAFT_144591 [Punctularia strigosozonata HHB-11173 SS5]|uniref:uncharacterized protein n=1 Tax=Punctularia strigosozonata (strain HHB-11173) TaxID=741275 RepID=UPI0004416AC7|nr:uncharacterized protein PUNSTDRAFT_144591 [Punctularia strigosozonata HHB-11173 SS5]EIN07016.1 hypothetical protein PUNSTDRAFT_144591 [Punctularia strigosozonata HHB-11173 SS5]
MSTSESDEPLLDDEHPLALELVSLRAAVARYQDEAHANAVKLQRHSLEASHALSRTRALEVENTRLLEEIATLRAEPAPDIAAANATHQAAELTLALRSLSDKLTATEATLAARSAELAKANNEIRKHSHEVHRAKEEVAKTYAIKAEYEERERELERRIWAAEEERNMADLVVQEYADLVRELEGRHKSPGHSRTSSSVSSSSIVSENLVHGLASNRQGLQRLFSEFSASSEAFEAEITRLHGELASLAAEREAERRAWEVERAHAAQTAMELEKLRIDDNTAAKMVSRYMKFSQQTTSSLQAALEKLKIRHAATISTYESQLASLQHLLSSSQSDASRLRDALDELTGELAKERFGRRREVALRLALLSREEALQEGLARWIRDAKQKLQKAGCDDPEDVKNACQAMLSAAGKLQECGGVDGDFRFASTARIIAAEGAVRALSSELNAETGARMALERRIARLRTANGIRDYDDEPPSVPPKSASFRPQSQETNGHIIMLPDNGQDIDRPPQHTHEQQPHLHDDVTPEVIEDRSATPSARGDVQVYISPSLAAAHTAGDTQSMAPSASAHAPSSTSQPLSRDDISNEPVLHPEIQQLDSVVAESEESTSPDVGQSSAYHAPPVEATASDLEEVQSRKAEPSPGVTTRTSSIAFPTDATESATPLSIENDAYLPALPSDDASTVAEEEAVAMVTPQPAKGDDIPTADGAHASIMEVTNENPLLVDLQQVKTRYDSMQRAFRDCHLALKALQSDIGVSQDDTGASSSAHSLGANQHHAVLRVAIERLSDFTEDARVELEIRIADEERMIMGYETLLSVPGALSSATDDGMGDLEKDIRLFVTGEDSAVQKALRTFGRKLEDVQHDIASVKRALHEGPAHEAEQPSAPPESPKATTWSWTGGLFGTSRSPSPAPTFGSVVTQPRLRHQNSSNRLFPQYQRRASAGLAPNTDSDPFAEIGLRVSMPSHVASLARSGTSQPSPQSRTRTISGMYMLGLGSGIGSRSALPTPSHASVVPPSPTPRRQHIPLIATSDEESEDSEDQNDVE